MSHGSAVRRGSFALAVLIGAAAGAAGQSGPRWLGGQVYDENDSLISGDDRYTQGLRFSVVSTRTPKPVRDFHDWLAGRLWSHERAFEPRFSLVFGQNLYTPEIITSPDPYPGDRGFAGVLYGGVQLQFTDVEQTVRHTFEGVAGLTGDASLAGGAQEGLHVLRFRRIPQGWEDLGVGVVLNVQYRLDRRFEVCGPWLLCADATLGGLAGLGNLQTVAGVHGAARVGRGLTGFPISAIPSALAPQDRPRFEIGAILGWEGRAVAYNGLLKPSGAGADFSRKPIVRDTRYGGYLRWKDVRLSILRVTRSPEFSIRGVPERSQSFGSVSLSYEPLGPPGAGTRRFLLRDWQLDLGLGTAARGPRLESGGRSGGPAGRVGVAKGLFGGLMLGFELAGMVVQNEPPSAVPAVHKDTFLLHRSLTLGWRPAWANERLILRAGATTFGLAKTETIDNTPATPGGAPGEERSGEYLEAGRRGWLAGVEYLMPLDPHIFFGVGVTYTRLRFRDPIPTVAQPDFVSVTLGVQLRP